MKKSLLVYGIAAIVLCAIIVRCNSGPTSPSDKVLGHIIFSEGFESDLSEYRQITYDPTQGKMSISTQYAQSGKGSLTSDSNNTGIKGNISPSIDDSIAGLQFYIMASKASHTDLLVAMCKTGSSANGLFTIMGMGIDKSDSLKYVYENTPDDSINEHKNFAACALNKWYKCKIEYNYTDTTLTYYLDDAVVRTQPSPSPMTLQTFIVMRDSLGVQGTSGYYVDNVSVYKR
ncbi:MAG TPA: hypothetical protein DCO75_13525 [Fibrobacteres bacterium]|jgi:hypothetical protein|nr:hypothetical protein [Fibrobacterota bacterium]